MPPTVKGVSKSPDSHMAEYYMAMKRDEHTTHFDKNLTALMCCKESQTQKNIARKELVPGVRIASPTSQTRVVLCIVRC